MKNFFASALQWKLRALARLTLARFKPVIIGVTGSVGKTSAKLAIGAVLANVRRVRSAPGNLNTDIGLPLTILGEWEERDLLLVSRETRTGAHRLDKAFFWMRVLVTGAWRLIFGGRERYPEVLVLEYGADRPGDIRMLLTIARPHHAVITAIGPLPAHLEFYGDPKNVAREKARLIERLPAAGYAVLNADNDPVTALQDRTGAHILTYGFSPEAHVRITHFEHRSHGGVPVGVSFKLQYGGSFVPVRQDGVFGRSAAYACGAGAAVGLIFGMNLVRISEALASYAPAPGRMQLMPGSKGSMVFDDTYNAGPSSMEVALEALDDLEAQRKIAVLGDMLEIGSYTDAAHREVGHRIAQVVDALVTVGERAKTIAEEARKRGLEKKNIHSFGASEEAATFMEKFVRAGDLVLVKGSHDMRMEMVVQAVAITYNLPPTT